MVKEHKEHWRVAIISGFIGMCFAFLTNYIIAKNTKIGDAATVEYVDKKDLDINIKLDEKHKEAIEYTDSEIKKRAETEQAYRDGLQNQLNSQGQQIGVIYKWVINQPKK